MRSMHALPRFFATPTSVRHTHAQLLPAAAPHPLALPHTCASPPSAADAVTCKLLRLVSEPMCRHCCCAAAAAACACACCRQWRGASIGALAVITGNGVLRSPLLTCQAASQTAHGQGPAPAAPVAAAPAGQGAIVECHAKRKPGHAATAARTRQALLCSGQPTASQFAEQHGWPHGWPPAAQRRDARALDALAPVVAATVAAPMWAVRLRAAAAPGRCADDREQQTEL